MTIKSTWRGHIIEYNKLKDIWFYSDTKKSVPNNPDIACGHCGKKPTSEGHDGCLGTLIGVMNACCGHGEENEAYVQFWDGNGVHGKDAIAIIEILKRCEPNKREDWIISIKNKDGLAERINLGK